jgi:hypothetical protein
MGRDTSNLLKDTMDAVTGFAYRDDDLRDLADTLRRVLATWL